MLVNLKVGVNNSTPIYFKKHLEHYNISSNRLSTQSQLVYSIKKYLIFENKYFK
jgi:hypothetical protein